LNNNPVFYEGYPEIKDKNGEEGMGNHGYKGGDTIVSSVLTFPFIFAFKET